MKGFLAALALFLFPPLSSAAQAAPAGLLLSQQTALSSEVRSALLESKKSMELLEAYYSGMMSELEAQAARQSEELTTLSTHLTDTMSSFRSASGALESLNIKLALEAQKRKFWMRLTLIGSILFLINLAAKCAAWALWKKGRKLPDGLNILI